METYILKAIICSAVLIILYYIFLQRERSFKFNRFYLLFAVLLSYAIPLISLKLPAVQTPKSNIIFQESVSELMVIPAQPAETSFDWTIILLFVYAGVAFFLLLKSVYSVTKILQLKGNLIKINGQKTKILEESISPFSFINTLYIGKRYFSNENSIDQRIFLHEKVHISQKHSLDLILVEVLMIISWFNPALYFYKKAIVTNHEFLADEDVISKNFDVKSYQQLILNEISTYNNLQFTNQFNYHNTKKRFIMMTRPDSRFSKLKKMLTLPVIALLTFFFTQKTYAGDLNSTNRISLSSQKNNFGNNSNKNQNSIFSIDPELEFLKILEKYPSLQDEMSVRKFAKELILKDKTKLQELYYQMTEEQQNRQKIFFRKSSGKFEKKVPTQKEMNNFQNKKYGIWIDNKRIKNSNLKNYNRVDFSHFHISELSKNAINYGKHYYQVNFMTNEFYQHYLQEPEFITMGFRKENILVNSPKVVNDTIRKPVVERKTVGTTNEVNYEIPPPAPQEGAKKQEVQNQYNIVPPTPFTPPLSKFTQVDELPEFPGGFNAFRSLVASSFNGAVLKGDEKLLKTTLNFVIDVNGKVVDVIAQGDNEIFNKEATRTAKAVNLNQTWKPAMKDGEPVRYRFKMPLQFSFGSKI